MPIIKPSSELRNRYNAISELCHKGEPVFLTKNGEGDVVVISIEKFDEMNRRLTKLDFIERFGEEGYEKLLEADRQLKAGAPTRDANEVMEEMRLRVKMASNREAHK